MLGCWCKWQGYFRRGTQVSKTKHWRVEGASQMTADREPRSKRDGIKEFCGVARPRKMEEHFLPKIEPRKPFYGKLPHCH